jgi:hypothetical protein
VKGFSESKLWQLFAENVAAFRCPSRPLSKGESHDFETFLTKVGHLQLKDGNYEPQALMRG